MFYGAKLKYIRMVSGLSRKELSDKLGITEQSVGQYETGMIIPKVDIRIQLNELFGVSNGYFSNNQCMPLLDIESKIAFRNSDREQRSKVEFEKYFLSDIHGYLKIFSEKINFFLNDLSEIKNSIVKDYEDLENDDIEVIANKMRGKLDITTNDNLMPMLERIGIIVLEKPFLNQTDACSVWVEGVPYIILGDQKKSFVRRNFDLAHELGHLILHANRDINTLDKKEFDLLEAQANHFASCFLLPRDSFLNDLQRIKKNISNPDAYIELKKKWKVSIAAMGYKAFKESEMTYQQYRYFNMSLNKKQYKIIEPLDKEFLILRPLRIQKMFEFLFENDVINLNKFLEIHGLSSKGMAHKFNLSEAFLRKYLNKKDNIVEFRF